MLSLVVAVCRVILLLYPKAGAADLALPPRRKKLVLVGLALR
jgi:hypothetical protein